MNSPAELLRASTLIFLGGLAVILLYRALTGGLRLRGLLSKVAAAARGPRGFSPARAQLLMIASLSALAVVAWGAGLVGQSWAPSAAVIALATSNLIYLRGKFLNLRSTAKSDQP